MKRLERVRGQGLQQQCECPDCPCCKLRVLASIQKSERGKTTLEVELCQACCVEGSAVSLSELLCGGKHSGMYVCIYLIQGLVIVVSFHERTGDRLSR